MVTKRNAPAKKVSSRAGTPKVQKSYDVIQTYDPSLKMALFAGALSFSIIWMTLCFGAYVYFIRAIDLDTVARLDDKIEKYTTTLSADRDAILLGLAKVRAQAASRWTATNMARFCEDFDKRNAKKGVSCPNPDNYTQPLLPPPFPAGTKQSSLF